MKSFENIVQIYFFAWFKLLLIKIYNYVRHCHKSKEIIVDKLGVDEAELHLKLVSQMTLELTLLILLS